MELTAHDRDLLRGDHGEAALMAMNVLVRLGDSEGARDFVDVAGAHVGSDFPGESTLDWLRTLVALGGRFMVPTTLNIASFDLLHPSLFQGNEAESEGAQEVMRLAAALGGARSWTCAPYLLEQRPELGQHVAWSESGAVVAANSLIGARSDRSGIFVDVCAALTGRVPRIGLHLDDERRARAVIDVSALPEHLFDDDLGFHLLGYWVGSFCGARVPILVGLPPAAEHHLQAFGAALATSGSVGMFHVVGVTPEAETLEAAVADDGDVIVLRPVQSDLDGVRDFLTSGAGEPIGAVCLGTPQYSTVQCRRLLRLIDESGDRVDRWVPFFVNISRQVLTELKVAGELEPLEERGVTLVTDTCTYLAPVLPGDVRTVLTSSAKWAYYGASQRSVGVELATTRDCVTLGQTGRLRGRQVVHA